MPAHRLKKASGTAAALNGASSQTAGVVFDTAGAVTNRDAIVTSPKFSPDGTLVTALLDGYWGTKLLVDATATAMVDIACPASAMIAGQVFYAVEFSDGVDFQCWSGQVAYSGYNKAATLVGIVAPSAPTGNATTGSGCDAKVASSGTLTLAWTLVTGANKMTLKLAGSGSLTETIIRITYFVLPIKGVPTIL